MSAVAGEMAAVEGRNCHRGRARPQALLADLVRSAWRCPRFV